MFSGKKALIVEDSKSERQILAKYLRNMGFEVYEAENGLDGLEKTMEIKPDIICMDIVMPGAFNGFQAIRAIYQHEELKRIPIILCTSKNEEKDKLWGKKQGAAGLLTTPINEETFSGTVKGVLIK